MSELALSVIIPTRGRPDILLQGLRFLEEQSGAVFEVIVVDDSPGEEAAQLLAGEGEEQRLRLTVLRSGGRGPSFAPNRALERARGERVLFLGDDTWARQAGFLARHARRGEGDALLGLVEWDPELAITDLMRFLAPNGPQFRYGDIKDERDAGYLHFFTSNISLPRSRLEAERFDEDFLDAALEDIELGYRLEMKGLRIAFERELVCYHHHAYDLDSFCSRMERTGRAARRFVAKHPECRKVYLPYPGWVMRQGSRLLASPLGRLLPRKLAWWGRIADAYLDGYFGGETA